MITFIAVEVYNDFKSSSDAIYSEVSDKEERRTKPVVIDEESEPISLLLTGVDTEEMGEGYQGRSDTMMLVTLNQDKNQTTIVSIPRDTYTEIIGRGTMDKINHAYAFGGPGMSINSVQNLFDVPIDYYVSVDMNGLVEIIDAIGGIEVTPPLTFSYAGYDFTEGVSKKLNGERALQYSRMRKFDPDGDYGRQERQRQVVEATIKKVASFSAIMNYQNVLNTLENNMSTDLFFEDMLTIFTNYKSAVDNIEQVQLTGTGERINGVYYDIIPDEEIGRVSEILKEELEI